MRALRATSGTLYLVPNLLGAVPPDAVLPQRTIDIARGLAHFVVETPKTARQFIKTLQPSTPIQSISFAQLDLRTPASRMGELLAPALAGQDLGLVSDAGCPGVADPGAQLVRVAHEAGVRVVPLVGPSAVLLALMASGMNGQQFAFHGYLPIKPAARNHTIKSLDDASAHATQIFIETPYRNEALAAAVLHACRSSTQFCAAVDLTLPSEQVICRSIAQWRKLPLPSLARRPTLFLIGSA